MEIIMISVLVAVAILLFILSYFKKDESTETDRKIENFSITLMKEMNQLNEKVTMIESEVFQNEKERSFAKALFNEKEKKRKILGMFAGGYSNEEIAMKLNVPEDDVEAIIILHADESEVVS